MVRPMNDSTTAPERVRSRFEDKARQFDDLYEDERWLVRTFRPGLFRRRKLAVDTVAAYNAPRVLDVGCGPGTITVDLAGRVPHGQVTGIDAARAELEDRGVKIGNWRVDERDGKRFQVFFVVAPDGLCYYFHEPLSG